MLKDEYMYPQSMFFMGNVWVKKKDYGKTDDDQDWSSFMSVYSL